MVFRRAKLDVVLLAVSNAFERDTSKAPIDGLACQHPPLTIFHLLVPSKDDINRLIHDEKTYSACMTSLRNTIRQPSSSHSPLIPPIHLSSNLNGNRGDPIILFTRVRSSLKGI
jgi:hypothetical protein